MFAYLLVCVFCIAVCRIAARKFLRYDAGTRGMLLRFMFGLALGLTLGYALAMVTSLPHETMKLLRQRALTSLNPSDVTLLHHNMEMDSTFASSLLKGVEEVTARRLAREVRVLCWIMTNPNNHVTKAFHVKTTWGRHCNTLLFMSEGEDSELPTVKLNVSSGRGFLWAKTVEAFKHVHQHYQDQYDWVLKADDDTYVVVENLRKLLLPYSSNEPIHFGFHFKPHVAQGYMSGGAGYVLSKEAVHRVVSQAFDSKHKDCPLPEVRGAEDVNMGRCLNAVNVKPGDSRDADGRSRFFPFDVEAHVNPAQGKKNWWYWDYIYWPMEGGLASCSDMPISFHYVTPVKMYMLEYLVYHVKTFPVTHLSMAPPVPKKKTAEIPRKQVPSKQLPPNQVPHNQVPPKDDHNPKLIVPVQQTDLKKLLQQQIQLGKSPPLQVLSQQVPTLNVQVPVQQITPIALLPGQEAPIQNVPQQPLVKP